MPNIKGFIFIFQNWKLIVHLLLNTKTFGVNNQRQSSFISTLLGNKRGLRYVWGNYKRARIRAEDIGFLSPITCYNLGWRKNWKYYECLYKSKVGTDD